MLVQHSGSAEVVDLGCIDAHRTVDCSFALTNATAKAKSCQGAHSSCACMRVGVARGNVASGGVLPVSVTFDPAGMEGPIEKTVWVDFKQGPSAVRTIRANVRQRLCFKPSDAAFGVIRSSDAGRTIEATLAGYAATNAVITAIMPSTNAFFDVSVGVNSVSNVVGDAVGGDHRAPRIPRLFIRFAHANPLPGTYAETWRIRTTDPEIPEIAFPVSARITDGFTVTPHVLTIDARRSVGGDHRAPRTDTPRTVSRAVTLRRDDRKPFKVLSAETKPRKWGDVKIVERPLGGWQVVVENIDPDAVRQFSKKPYLEVKIDLPDVEMLCVPLRVE